MITIGLTGGIGSGKTLISNIFKIFGISVFNADDIAKFIINNNEKVINTLKKKYGFDIYSNNIINKKKLSKIIFHNKNELDYINKLIHPLVFDNFNEWKNKQKSPYVIMEAAILFESNANKLCNKTITVFSPKQTRINRIKERDKISEDEIKKRMKHQLDENEKIKLADYIIYNDNKQAILPQIINIHNSILNI